MSLPSPDRSLQVLVPEAIPPARIKSVAVQGPLPFLIAEQVEEVQEDGWLIEGGDGLLIVAKALDDGKGRFDRFAALVAHFLFPQALEQMSFSGSDLGEITP